MAKEREFAVIDKQGNVLNVIVWDGTWYDPLDNPSGLMFEAQLQDRQGNLFNLADCQLFEISLQPLNELELAEPGGLFDFTYHEFTRAESLPHLEVENIKLTGIVAQIVKILVDQKILAPEILEENGISTENLQLAIEKADPIIIPGAL